MNAQLPRAAVTGAVGYFRVPMVQAAWLILYGNLTAPFLSISFPHGGDFLAVLAVVTGVLLLLQR